MADDDFPLFLNGMVLVVEYPRQGIGEDGEAFLKRNAVLGEVGSGLFRVPLEFQVHPERCKLSPLSAFVYTGVR